MLMWEIGLYILNVSANPARRVRNSADSSLDNIQVALIRADLLREGNARSCATSINTTHLFLLESTVTLVMFRSFYARGRPCTAKLVRMQSREYKHQAELSQYRNVGHHFLLRAFNESLAR